MSALTQATLMDIFDRMLQTYGPQHWWPGDGWFETMVGAVLTQATSWTNVEKAIANLKNERLLSPPAIRKVDQTRLTQLIYPSGYYNAKARKLKALASFIEGYDDKVERMKAVNASELCEQLLAVHGVGNETADAILLYALEKPVFVVDAYTKRIFSRLGLISEKASYSYVKRAFEENLTRDVNLFSEYHALTVQHSKGVCRKNPICSECCLLSICPTGRQTIN